MCLARTELGRAEAPRPHDVHRQDPPARASQVEPIRLVDGSLEFCQEFFDDVPIPAADVIGEVDDGWTVAHATARARAQRGGRRVAVPQRTAPAATRRAAATTSSLELVKASGRTGDAHLRQLVAEAAVDQLVGQQLVLRVTEGVATGEDGAAGQLGAQAVQRHEPDASRRDQPRGRRVSRGGVAGWLGRTRRRPSVSSACGARACRWAAAATRSSATSSASASSGCPASSPPTVRCPTAT